MSTSSPIILLAGGAGSGKDTVGGFIAKYIPNTTLIAQADPMKRFGQDFFLFTEVQLWGPTHTRNAVDERFSRLDMVVTVRENIKESGFAWVNSVLPQLSGFARKDAFEALTDWSEHTLEYGLEHGGLSARYVLQTLGTEWGRAVYQNVWTEYATNTAWRLLEGGYAYSKTNGLSEVSGDRTDLVGVTDGRFRNEILNWRRQNAFMMRILTPTPKVLDAGVKNHKSETELLTIPPHWFNLELVNDKEAGLDKLEFEVNYIVSKYIQPNIHSLGTTWVTP